MASRKTGCAAEPTREADAGQDAVTLDPRNDAEWAQLRSEAHRILDETLDGMRDLRGAAAWQPVPAPIAEALDTAPAPLGERSLSAVYAEVASRILPYTSANRHPRAWGWVRGQGTPVAMIADMIASAANAHVGSGSTAPMHVERTVIRWLAEALDVTGARPGEAASGLLTSGATMANLLGLAVARHARAAFDVRAEGLAGQAPMRLYCSMETHLWAVKAVELLGLGRKALRQLPADREGRLPVEALRAAVAEDRNAGLSPLAVIANAGTVNTGAVDDLRAVRELCDREGLWMHVDGAFGALLKLTPQYRELVDGLEHADSIAFDLHKWISLPFDTGCLLVRDAQLHRETFQSHAPYMERGGRGMLAGTLSFSDLGIESSRSFRALRAWMQLSVHGLAKHGATIARNVEQAAYLEARIAEHAENLELMAPRRMNIVCFRYAPPALRQESDQLNELNRAVMHALQESGEFVVSGTTLTEGAFALRIAITNHRSRFEDFDALLAAVLAYGQLLSAQ